jgi:hypothetical protein
MTSSWILDSTATALAAKFAASGEFCIAAPFNFRFAFSGLINGSHNSL